MSNNSTNAYTEHAIRDKSAIAFELTKTTPLGSRLLALFWTQFSVALVSVCARFYARQIAHSLGWDDWIMLAAMVRHVFLMSRFPKNEITDCSYLY